MQAGGEPLTLVGSLLMRFDDDGLCTDLREYWQSLPELRDPWPGWGELLHSKIPVAHVGDPA